VATSPPGKADIGRGKAKATDLADEVNDVEENTKCTILHKGREITVSISALPAHVLNHGDELVTVEEEPEDIEQEQPEDVEQLDDCQALYDALMDTEPDPTDPNTGETDTGNTGTTDSSTTRTLQQQQSEQDEGMQWETTETVQTCDDKSIELSKAEKLTLNMHNKTRENKGLKQLCVDPILQKAARAHSADMIKKHYFAHNSPDGKTSGKRLKDLGYDWRATGENIAWGSGSYSKPESRFKAWMKSEGHKKNILNKNFEQVGIGVAKGKLAKGNEEATFYTVDFGSKKKK